MTPLMKMFAAYIQNKKQEVKKFDLRVTSRIKNVPQVKPKLPKK